MTIVGLDIWTALFCVVVVFAGALLQGVIGTGTGLLAAPLLTLVDTDFVPGAVALTVVWLTFGMTMRERTYIDRHGTGLALAARVPGSFLGAWVAATTGDRVISIVIGVTVLLAVIASGTRVRVTPTTRNVLIAGVASGFTGTATGVGGPPMAIAYQHSDPRIMRATLSALSAFGGVFSITLLVISGVIGRREIELAALLLPGIIAGFLVSKSAIKRIPTEKIRPFVLSTCAASALLLLLEPLI